TGVLALNLNAMVLVASDVLEFAGRSRLFTNFRRLHEHSSHVLSNCSYSRRAALLRELGIAFLSKLEQMSQRARWPVAREKHKTSSFAMTISKQPLRRRPD